MMPYDPYNHCYYEDPRGLGGGGYDRWKLRSPDDEYDHEPPDECDHTDYEIDYEGRAECQHCDHRWWPSPEVVKAYDEAVRRHEREWRRYNSWYMRAWRWARDRYVRWRHPVTDDIPF